MHRRTLLAALTTLAGCGAPPTTDIDDHSGTSTTVEPTPSVGQDAVFGLPSVESGGNPVVGAPLDIRAAEPVDVDLPGPPVWLAGVPLAAGSRWAAVLDDGRVVGVRLTDDGATTVPLSPETVDGPPLLVADERDGEGDGIRVAAPPTLAPHTHPVPAAGGLAWVRGDGRLRTPGGVVAVDALPDAVPVSDGDRVFVLTGPTDSYGHAVLGDELEAQSLTVVDAASGTVERQLRPPAGTVVEGRSTMLATLGGDQAAVVTASDDAEGARIVALGVDGSWRAVGPPVGGGFRWRHQLAVAPFSPDGAQAIAVVKTPHIGGVAEFYRRDGDRLRIAATAGGNYRTHEIGSRNLGGAVAGRFAGDDRWLLLLPDDRRQSLVGLVWTQGADPSIDRAFSLSLGGALTTNVAAVDGRSGTAPVVAAGTESNLRFWRQ